MIHLKTDCLHHGPLDKVRPDPGIFVRFVRALRPFDNKTHAVHLPDLFKFSVPAKGDGYEFSVTVHFTWCVTGRAFGYVLAHRVLDNRTRVLERLLGRVREVSRRYPPYDAAAAEANIHRCIAEIFNANHLVFVAGEEAAARPDGDARAIEFRTAVHLDKPVREAQQEAWSRRQKVVNEHDLARVMAGHLSESRQLWQSFLREGARDWLTPYAVALAKSPDEAADVISRMFRDRHDQVGELAEQVVKQTKAYGGLDAFELMTQNDTVLRRLMTMMGIEQAPPLELQPFEDEPHAPSNGHHAQ